MNVQFSLFVLPSVTVFFLGLMIGCGPHDPSGGPQDAIQSDRDGQQPASIDPHDAPITEEQKQQLRKETAKFVDAVAKVSALRNIVEHETRNGLPENPFAVHQALDLADLVVQWLPEIARDSNVPKEHWERVTTSANELREFFDKVHLNVDNKADPDFASVKQPMDVRIGELQSIAE